MWDGLMTAIGNNIDNTKTNWANFIMNERTNSSNRSIADSTNEANYRLWQEQLAYQKERYEQEKAENQRLVTQSHDWEEQAILRQHQWDLEKRAFDDYQSQIQRMRKAGLNPYLMTGQTSSVSGAGSTSAGNSPVVGQNPSFPTASPIPFDKGFPMQVARWQSLSQTGSGWFDMAAKKQEVDNDTIRALADAQEKGVNSKVLMQTFDKLAQDIKWNHDSWDIRMKNLELANDALFADTQYKDSMREYQKIINGFTPEMQRKLLRQYDAQYDELMSAADSHNKEAAYKAALASLTGLDEGIKRDMADAIVDDAFNKAEHSYWDSERAGRQYLLGDKIGNSTPAMDLNGKSYSSPQKSYSRKRPRRYSNYIRRDNN